VIVECPRCRARYRVEAGLLDEDQTFKCSRCGHIFAYQAETAAAHPSASPPAPHDEAKAEPEFDVGRSEPLEPTPSDADDSVVAAPPPPPPPPPPPELRPQIEPPKPDIKRTMPRADSDSLSFEFKSSQPAKPASERPPANEPDEHELDDFTFEDEPVVTKRPEPPPRAPSIGDEPRFLRGEDDLREEQTERASAGRPYLAFLVALVIVYALFALNLLNHPAQAEKLLANIPVIGEVLAVDHLLQIRVQLQDVDGAFQQIKDDRVVFIVSGRAVNSSAQPLKGVQIESTLYDSSGNPVETKSIYTGNAMSLKVVKDLSSKEISLLQRLEPPKRFEIRPGESAGFSVVFLSPPKASKEFTARVVSAQSSAS
jgi:predicted Zn finger-like uncharacterized protein